MNKIHIINCYPFFISKLVLPALRGEERLQYRLSANGEKGGSPMFHDFAMIRINPGS